MLRKQESSNTYRNIKRLVNCQLTGIERKPFVREKHQMFLSDEVPTLETLGAVHTKIDLSWIDLRSISARFEKVFTLI